MFFPTLNGLKMYKIDDISISKLDGWLGTRRKAVIDSLNPLQFSVDTGIDEQYSIYIFALSTQIGIAVLKARYVIECPLCDTVYKVVYDLEDIPKCFVCNECGSNLKNHEDYVTIWFELIIEPQEIIISEDVLDVVRTVSPLGKLVASALV